MSAHACVCSCVCQNDHVKHINREMHQISLEKPGVSDDIRDIAEFDVFGNL